MELKDVIHFYLNCEMLAVGTSDDYDDNYFELDDIGKLTLINKGSIQIQASPDTDNYPYGVSLNDGKYVCGGEELFKVFKLILRKLEDITEEEKKEFKNICGLEKEDLDCLIEHTGSIFEPDVKYFGTAHLTNILQWALGVQYLLSKNFDLFNLISEGKAIDKNTLT